MIARNLAPKRIQQHEVARAKMREGNFLAATELLTNLRIQWGPHLLASCDLMACYFMNDRPGDADLLFREISEIIYNEKSPIGIETRSRVGIFIGKMLEEQGDLEGALRSYRRVFELIGEQGRFQFLSAMQIKRLANYWGQEILAREFHVKRSLFNSIGLALESVDFLKFIESSDDTKMEFRHLVVSEMASIHRWDEGIRLISEVFADPQVLEPDRRLLLIDFLETLLISKVSLTTEQMDSLRNLLAAIPENSFERYESIVVSLFLGRASFQDVSLLGLARMSQVRILNLVSIRSEETKADRRKVLLMLRDSISSLSSRNQKIIYARSSNEKIRLTPITEEMLLGLNSDERAVIEILKNGQPVLTENIVRAIFKLEWSPSAVNRLRKQVSRLNLKLRMSFNSPLKIHVGKEFCHLLGELAP